MSGSFPATHPDLDRVELPLLRDLLEQIGSAFIDYSMHRYLHDIYPLSHARANVETQSSLTFKVSVDAERRIPSPER